MHSLVQIDSSSRQRRAAAFADGFDNQLQWCRSDSTRQGEPLRLHPTLAGSVPLDKTRERPAMISSPDARGAGSTRRRRTRSRLPSDAAPKDPPTTPNWPSSFSGPEHFSVSNECLANNCAPESRRRRNGRPTGRRCGIALEFIQHALEAKLGAFRNRAIGTRREVARPETTQRGNQRDQLGRTHQPDAAGAHEPDGGEGRCTTDVAARAHAASPQRDMAESAPVASRPQSRARIVEEGLGAPSVEQCAPFASHPQGPASVRTSCDRLWPAAPRNARGDRETATVPSGCCPASLAPRGRRRVRPRRPTDRPLPPVRG